MAQKFGVDYYDPFIEGGTKMFDIWTLSLLIEEINKGEVEILHVEEYKPCED